MIKIKFNSILRNDYWYGPYAFISARIIEGIVVYSILLAFVAAGLILRVVMLPALIILAVVGVYIFYFLRNNNRTRRYNSKPNHKINNSTVAFLKTLCAPTSLW